MRTAQFVNKKIKNSITVTAINEDYVYIVFGRYMEFRPGYDIDENYFVFWVNHPKINITNPDEYIISDETGIITNTINH